MKKLLLLLPLLCVAFAAVSQITFRFSPSSVSASDPTATMEKNVADMLNAVNAAAQADTTLNFASVDIEPAAVERLNALWESVRFSVDKEKIITKCLHDVQGYQARGIFITMHPRDDSYTQSLQRELTLSFDRAGRITGARLAMESLEDIAKILGEGEAVTDMAQRREMLKFVEDFRCYYNEKNIDALEKIFSDNALIITGSVIRKGLKGSEAGIAEGAKVKYKVLSKKQYIDNLRKVFRDNAKLNVTFDRIQVVRNGAKESLYGVTLHQSWQSTHYSDEGWLFLYWDLSNPEEPKILIRTWQDDETVEAQGIFNINDFVVP